MSADKQKEIGLAAFRREIEDVKRNRAAGRLCVARDDFFSAEGMLRLLRALNLISDEECDALRKDLFEAHYVHA